ncbi:pre-mRNA-splicing factor cwf23 [Carex littledalei]|uniref:Pre-mRNA-splicing factor cwf23 n=1 Tax=Carex littledalei TaxID=544730 RepID=A0A833R7D2_9POAL|nr:pre-mRNA-splicing factor cwf23 [Carex littledalei]
MARELDSKENLAGVICKISEIFTSCRHRHHTDGRSTFLDWYLILGVDQEAGDEVIRKRYRQLALQLHPDKNKHHKADAAFKLVLEAYSCLSDEAKRRIFDSFKCEKFCIECYEKFNSSQNGNGKEENTCTNTSTTYKSSKRFIHAFKELQKRLSKECRVIENCLRATNQSLNGYPVFDPDNRVFYPEYPYFRMPVSGENANHFPSNGVAGFKRRGSKRESSVYNVGCEVNIPCTTESTD